MTIKSSGIISISDIEAELLVQGIFNLGSDLARELAGKPSGYSISLSDFYGKSSYKPGAVAFYTPGYSTFTVPKGVYKIYVGIVGGGGSGAGGIMWVNYDGAPGSGGGSGEFAAYAFDVTPGQVVALTVGAGGAIASGVTNTAYGLPGNPGQRSYFYINGNTYSAGGGSAASATYYPADAEWGLSAQGILGFPGSSYNSGSSCIQSGNGRWNPDAGIETGVYSYCSGGGGGVGGGAYRYNGGVGMNGYVAGTPQIHYDGFYGFYYGFGGGGGGYLSNGVDINGGTGGGGGAGGAGDGSPGGAGGVGCVVIKW